MILVYIFLKRSIFKVCENIIRLGEGHWPFWKTKIYIRQV